MSRTRSPIISESVRNLWGRDFALVPDGLSEGDVTSFVEEMMSRHKEADERLEHLDSLHRLATETLHRTGALSRRHIAENRVQAAGGLGVRDELVCGLKNRFG